MRERNEEGETLIKTAASVVLFNIQKPSIYLFQYSERILIIIPGHLTGKWARQGEKIQIVCRILKPITRRILLRDINPKAGRVGLSITDSGFIKQIEFELEPRQKQDLYHV